MQERDIRLGKKSLADETGEQQAVLEWAALQSGKWPELELLYHIPNEGKRSGAAGEALRRMGMKRGVPDLCLPVARRGYHGLYVEMKRKGGRVSKEQGRWVEELKSQGYAAKVCFGFEEAVETIKWYMG